MLVSRQIEFLKLILNENKYRPIKYFKDKLNVSDKTLQKDLKMIEKYLETFNIKNLLYKKDDSLKVNRYFVVENNKYKLLLYESFKKEFGINSMDLAQLKLNDFGLKYFKEVDLILKKAIAINPTDSKLYYAQACNYMNFDGFPGYSDTTYNALDSINKSLKYLDKNDSDYKKNASNIYNLKGVILMFHKRFDEAQQYLNKALYFNKDNKDPKYNLNTIKKHLN
ncbi:HTH domain-containing protein [Clostridioides difficile]|uniref:helix-turn-helix domain-containing protein n=1 Tax=Clostridioides difficile TaxID=1496 RepID=UPI00254B136E|nr:helix-turn-helix domain-containing protein [Clostridioides difficile]MDL0217832.1 HTH domain-containing protein [Clostridioides difficile]